MDERVNVLTSPLERVARYKKLASLSAVPVADVEPPSVIVVLEVVVLSPIMMIARSG